MGLVSNSKSSLYGGVNQQSAEHRYDSQVEECINAYPTIENGLVKRNPTTKKDVVGLVYEHDMWTHEYDKGLSGDIYEKYSLQITTQGMQIIDVENNSVLNEENNGIVFSGDDARDYIGVNPSPTSHSAITIKDSTFITNKSVTPRMLKDSYDNGDSVNSTEYHYKDITLSASTREAVGLEEDSDLDCNLVNFEMSPKAYAPYSYSFLYYRSALFYVSNAGTISITVDGNQINYKSKPLDSYFGYHFGQLEEQESFSEWIENVKITLSEGLDSTIYQVSLVGTNIRIKKLDGTIPSVLASITFNPEIDVAHFDDSVGCAVEALESDFLGEIVYGSTTEDTIVQNDNYENDGFVWIKGSNPTAPYTYTVAVTDESGNSVTASATETTTDAAASSLAATINADANFNATSLNSIIKITSTTDKISSVNVADSFGNQASFGWAKEAAEATDLPKSLGFPAIVHITGNSSSSFKGYWLKYSDNTWTETVSPFVDTEIDKRTMPHIIQRGYDSNGNIFFSVSPYEEWSQMRVGDYDTNKIPSFADGATTINDLFFFKNRLGFITSRTVVMSEIGEYGNFWRTTVSALLDSDRIDVSVDATTLVDLEYATYLEDNIMLFSDKAQFKLDGGKILSPSSVQISQTSAYSINKNIRPIFMNNKIFFCANRGKHTAVMQYYVSGDGRVSEAVNITSHVDRYIPSDVVSMTGSSINNMLFLHAKSTPDTIYVYKYIDNGDKREQSAWFKWTYNGSIFKAFSFGENLNILINRIQSSAASDWILGNGVWDDDELWIDNYLWVDNPEALDSTNNLEVQMIHPIDHTGYFIDASEEKEDVNNIISLESTATSTPLVYSAYLHLLRDVKISLLGSAKSYTIDVTTNLGTHSFISEDAIVNKNPNEIIESVTIEITEASPIRFSGFSCVYIGDEDKELLYNSAFTSGGTNRWSYSNYNDVYELIDAGSTIPVTIDLGEWVLKSSGKALQYGDLQFKTCKINSEDGSDFKLNVYNVKRETSREIDSKYTVDRSPMIYGKSKDIRLSIKNNSTKGFRINSVNFEGNYNTRNRRI